MLELISSLMPLVNKVIDLIPDPAAKQRAQLEMQTKLLDMAAQEANNQSEINKIEAGNPNVFVAGWRPFIGWVCAVGFAWTYVAVPIISWMSGLFGVVPYIPKIDNGLYELTMAMLGMGALRSFDKWKGTTK